MTIPNDHFHSVAPFCVIIRELLLVVQRALEGYRCIADTVCFLVRHTLRNNANMFHGWQLNITNTKDLYSLVYVTAVLF